MAVVSISSLPKDREAELEQVAELAVSLSGRLTRLRVNEIGPAIAAALKQIAEVIGVDSCRLMQFADGSPAREPLPGGGELHTEERIDDSVDGWLIERLGRGDIVAISQPRTSQSMRVPRVIMRVGRGCAPYWACRRGSPARWYAGSSSTTFSPRGDGDSR